MGLYINPQGEEKETWLARYGTPSLNPPSWAEVPKDSLPVCLVDNGSFTTAAIGFGETEWKRFLQPDRRTRLWFVVPVKNLETVIPNIREFLG